jgi:hypothetical protein
MKGTEMTKQQVSFEYKNWLLHRIRNSPLPFGLRQGYLWSNEWLISGLHSAEKHQPG